MTLEDFMNDQMDWTGPDRLVPPCPLSPDEEMILDLAKKLQVNGMGWAEVARRRLLGLPLEVDEL